MEVGDCESWAVVVLLILSRLLLESLCRRYSYIVSEGDNRIDSGMYVLTIGI